MDVVIVPQEVWRDFSRSFELPVLSDNSLDLFDKCVFRVVAGDVEGSVVRVLKLLGFSELDDPRRNRNRAVRGRLIEADFQENSILETGD